MKERHLLNILREQRKKAVHLPNSANHSRYRLPQTFFTRAHLATVPLPRPWRHEPLMAYLWRHILISVHHQKHHHCQTVPHKTHTKEILQTLSSCHLRLFAYQKITNHPPLMLTTMETSYISTVIGGNSMKIQGIVNLRLITGRLYTPAIVCVYFELSCCNT